MMKIGIEVCFGNNDENLLELLVNLHEDKKKKKKIIIFGVLLVMTTLEIWWEMVFQSVS